MKQAIYCMIRHKNSPQIFEVSHCGGQLEQSHSVIEIKVQTFLWVFSAKKYHSYFLQKVAVL